MTLDNAGIQLTRLLLKRANTTPPSPFLVAFASEKLAIFQDPSRKTEEPMEGLVDHAVQTDSQSHEAWTSGHFFTF